MSQPKSNEGHTAYSPEINAVRAVLVKYFNEYPADLLADLAQLLAQKDAELQKAREQRKGWKGYVAVDPQAGHYKYSPVFSDRKGAELWVKGKEISGLEVVEVDILLADHSELDQDKV